MSLLTIAQLVVSILLIVLILIQEREAGVSALFGGAEGGLYRTRRCLEKVIFIATLVLIGIFAALSLLNLVS